MGSSFIAQLRSDVSTPSNPAHSVHIVCTCMSKAYLLIANTIANITNIAEAEDLHNCELKPSRLQLGFYGYRNTRAIV